MNKRKIILIVTLIVLLFALTGCSVPTENGAVKLITDETTFKYMFDNEGFFSSLIVFPLAKAMNFFASTTGSATLAIVLVTIAVNAVLLALTWKASVNQQKMMLLQPELKRIQNKYAGRTDEGSKMQQAQEMQMLYQKHGINPLGSLGTMFLQFPIMIGIYHAVTRSYYVSKGSLLGLSLETTIAKGVLNNKQYGYLIIFFVMIALQFASMKLPQYIQQLRAKKEAERHFRRYEKPENPTEMMTYGMTAMIAIFALTLPSGMSIYWATSSAVMLAKTLFLNNLVEKEKEALGK